MKRYFYILIMVACFFTITACHSAKAEPEDASTVSKETAGTETTEEESDTSNLLNAEKLFLGIWVEPVGEYYIFKIKADHTIEAWFNTGELEHLPDGTWHLEGNGYKVIIGDYEETYSFGDEGPDVLIGDAATLIERLLGELKVGETYQTQDVLKVKEKPEKDSRVLMRSELSEEDLAISVDGSDSDDALIQEGSVVTCQEVSGDWIKISSGWICSFDEGEVLLKKAQ